MTIAREVGKAISEPLPVPLLVFVFVQQPGIGINHSFFLEVIPGTQGSYILVALGMLDPIDDAFDAVVGNMTYLPKSSALLLGIIVPVH